MLLNVLVKSNKKETVQRNSTIDFITMISLLFTGQSMKDRQFYSNARVQRNRIIDFLPLSCNHTGQSEEESLIVAL